MVRTSLVSALQHTPCSLMLKIPPFTKVCTWCHVEKFLYEQWLKHQLRGRSSQTTVLKHPFICLIPKTLMKQTALIEQHRVFSPTSCNCCLPSGLTGKYSIKALSCRAPTCAVIVSRFCWALLVWPNKCMLYAVTLYCHATSISQSVSLFTHSYSLWYGAREYSCIFVHSFYW